MAVKPARARLGINIDHVATLRNARERDALAHPDLLRAAQEAQKGGADSITFHLREDRRHILDQDAARLQKLCNLPINLEMAATIEMRDIALHLRPHAVCLVPEKRREVTTEGGLDAKAGGERLRKLICLLQSARIRVSLFITPDPQQIEAAHQLGAAAIELHTGRYCNSKGAERRDELKRIKEGALLASRLGLEVHAGHGLNFLNVAPIARMSEISELNIGHYLVGEAVFIGLSSSVRKMRKLIDGARKSQ